MSDTCQYCDQPIRRVPMFGYWTHLDADKNFGWVPCTATSMNYATLKEAL